MFPDLVSAEGPVRPPPPARHAATPALFSPTERAERRFWEFFTAHIRNRNTRLAYLAATRLFAGWCERRGLALDQVEPMVVAAYVEELTRARSPTTVKQHLAALRMLFDWLVVGQVLPFNPASSVRGPRHVVKAGKTPILSAKETRALLDGIDVSTLRGDPQHRSPREIPFHRLSPTSVPVATALNRPPNRGRPRRAPTHQCVHGLAPSATALIPDARAARRHPLFPARLRIGGRCGNS